MSGEAYSRSPSNDGYGADCGRFRSARRRGALRPWTCDCCQGCCEQHLLVRSACDISSSRSDFTADAARSDRQWRPKAVAQRLALDGREHSVKLRQSGDTAVSRPFSSVSTTATIPRGARHRARVARRELVFGRPKGRYHDAVMRIGGEAPRRRAHSKPRREGHSPTSGCRCLGPSSAAERQCDARLQQLNGAYAAGRSRRPAGISPVVTNRHSMMRSLRASATIMVLRVPPRPSDARFQYHAVSGLPFCCTK
jgi:hypothetical protein